MNNYQPPDFCRMVERQYEILTETCYAFSSFGELLGQYLDRYIPTEFLVFGLVDFSHAALADLSSNGIMRK